MIFLTGASGYLGSHVKKGLLKKGYTVKCLSRKKYSGSSREIWVKGDLKSPGKWISELKDATHIVHMGALADLWSLNTEDFYTCNVKATEQILKTALKYKVKRIIYTSTAGTLGPSIDEPVSEHSDYIPTSANPYNHTKWKAEQLIKKADIEWIILNPSRLTGHGYRSRANAVTPLLVKYAERHLQLLPGAGKTIGNYVSVKDTADAHITAMFTEKTNEQYIIGGQNLSYRDLFSLVDQVLERKSRFIYIPMKIVKSFAAAGDVYGKMGFRPPITNAFAQKFYYNHALSTSKAERELGFSPAPLYNVVSEVLKDHTSTLA